MGYVGNNSAIVNAGRSAAIKKEYEDFCRELEEKALAPVKVETEKLTRALIDLRAEQKAAAIQALKYRLTHEPSSDFRTEDYASDGHDSADDITNKIQAAMGAWLQSADPKPDEVNARLVAGFIAVNEQADLTVASTWAKAWEFIIEKFRELDEQFEAPEPVQAPAPTSKFPEHDELLTDLERQLTELPVGNSRAREALERRIHTEQVRKELLGTDFTREVLGEIATQSGLTISSTVSLQFLNWLGSPLAKRRFGSDKSDIRRAWAEFAGDDSFLTPEERQQIADDKSFDRMTSDQVAAKVGIRRDYGVRSHAGIRQGEK